MEGTLIHTLWHCPKIMEFLEIVTDRLKEAVGVNFEGPLKTALLGIWDPRDLTRHQKILVNMGFMIAKRDSAQKWGSVMTPTFPEWEAGMDKCMALEKEIYKGRGCPKKFEKIWGGWEADGM